MSRLAGAGVDASRGGDGASTKSRAGSAVGGGGVLGGIGDMRGGGAAGGGSGVSGAAIAYGGGSGVAGGGGIDGGGSGVTGACITAAAGGDQPQSPFEGRGPGGGGTS